VPTWDWPASPGEPAYGSLRGRGRALAEGCLRGRRQGTQADEALRAGRARRASLCARRTAGCCRGPGAAAPDHAAISPRATRGRPVPGRPPRSQTRMGPEWAWGPGADRPQAAGALSEASSYRTSAWPMPAQRGRPSQADVRRACPCPWPAIQGLPEHPWHHHRGLRVVWARASLPASPLRLRVASVPCRPCHPSPAPAPAGRGRAVEPQASWSHPEWHRPRLPAALLRPGTGREGPPRRQARPCCAGSTWAAHPL